MRDYELTVMKTEQPCSLHACLRHALRLARWAGFFPVQGLGQACADGTRFKMKCIYSCYCITTIIGQGVMVSFTLLLFFQNDVDLRTVANIIFYVSSLSSAILLLKLAQQWPKLMAKATETEQSLTELKLDNKTVVQTTIIAYVAMTLALIEHILCESFNIRFVMNCLEAAGMTSNMMENYIVHWMPYVFDYIPYNTFSAVLFEFICFQSTFLWSFNDVMITCFSIYITAYFRSFNKVIAINAGKDKDRIPWGLLRAQYSSLVKLVQEIDATLSSFILIAFVTDLFYICLQLFNSLHRNHVSFKYCDEFQTKQALNSPYYLLYYLYSFIFLVLRALMLSLFASSVHSAGLEPVYSIYDVPTPLYDLEVRRFQFQLQNAKVGLSGKFFSVTRNMIVKVISTIVTYEIVLLQYSIKSEPYYNNTTSAPLAENVTEMYGQTLYI